MLGLILILMLASIPAVLAWFFVDLLPFKRRIWPKIIGALSGGLLVAGLMMWNDAQEGFCCREYKATAWTELWFYVPLCLVLALTAYPVIAFASSLRRLLLGKGVPETPPTDVFE